MLTESLTERVKERLAEGMVVNEPLPNGGVLHIDKLLPYICIYRYREEEDLNFSGLLRTQAAYLICEESFDLYGLLEAVSRVMTKNLHAFLILEMWPIRQDHQASFNIYCPDGKSPATLTALQDGINELADIFPDVSAIIKASDHRHPPGMDPLFTIDESKMAGILIIGMAIPAIYEDAGGDEVYALFRRKLIKKFSKVVKRAAFEFIRVQTSNPFHHYLMLGKTHLDKVSKQADRELAGISEGMSFLLRVSPVNATEEWKRFRDCGFSECPSFNYRLIAIDPELLKRKLYNIPIEMVEDPTLAFIFRDKRREIEKQLTMLEERGTDNFRYISQSLYGKLDTRVIEAADTLLETFGADTVRKAADRMNCYEFAARAREEIASYNKDFPKVPFTVEIRKDVSGIMVSKARLLISDEFSVDKKRSEALIQHEIGTHMLTYGNGKKQPLHQMYAGFAGYDQLQEGLAVLSEYLVGGLTVNRMRLLAGRVKAVESMISGAGFVETFNMLVLAYGFAKKVAFYICVRIYRGGGLTKDALYLTGLLNVMDYIRKGGDLQTLYTGKFNINHVDLVEELLHRSVLKAPVIPAFYKNNTTKERLERIVSGIRITDLVN